MTDEKTIQIAYYAILREERGCSEETLQSNAPTPRDLYDQLKTEHSFTLDTQHLKVVVNDNFTKWDIPLQDGDHVVFIPPVAGG